jgi:hypothetical protein
MRQGCAIRKPVRRLTVPVAALAGRRGLSLRSVEGLIVVHQLVMRKDLRVKAMRPAILSALMSFSERNKITHKYPERDVYEEAPERVRAILNTILQGDAYNAYIYLCEKTGRMPDSDIWGDSFSAPQVKWLVERLEWWEVFDALEWACDGNGYAEGQVNEAFAREGLAYEMVDGSIWTLDEEGAALEIGGNEYEAEKLLTDKFEPVRKQYHAALEALHGRPTNLEKAISEAAGALEAVVTIISGETNFDRGVSKVMANVEAGGALAQSMKGIYNYASQVPGARHGRHAEPEADLEEARYVVRTAGDAIAYLIRSASR